MPDNSTLGDRLFVGAAKTWRNLWGAQNLPLDKRIYMESVIDRRRDPVTEKSLTPAEQEQLRGLIVNRYERIKPQLQQDLKTLRVNAQDAMRDAISARATPEAKAWHLKRYRGISERIEGIKSYMQTGKLNPVVVDYVKNDVPTNIQYGDYDDPLEVNSDAGAKSRGTARQTSVGQTLGRFNYEVDPQGVITVKDIYDFGQGVNGLTGLPVKNTPVSVGDLLAPKKAAVKYGRARLPEGQGRPVTIRLNSLAPPTRPPENKLIRPPSFFGY